MPAKPRIHQTPMKRDRRGYYKIMGGLFLLLVLLTIVAALGPRAREGSSLPRNDRAINSAFPKLRR
jgi:hypothetical protein